MQLVQAKRAKLAEMDHRMRVVGSRVQNGSSSLLDWIQSQTDAATGADDYAEALAFYRTAEITGTPAAGYTSAQAIAAMEEVASQILPSDMSYEWSGLTLQEKKAEGQAGVGIDRLSRILFEMVQHRYPRTGVPYQLA